MTDTVIGVRSDKEDPVNRKLWFRTRSGKEFIGEIIDYGDDEGGRPLDMTTQELGRWCEPVGQLFYRGKCWAQDQLGFDRAATDKLSESAYAMRLQQLRELWERSNYVLLRVHPVASNIPAMVCLRLADIECYGPVDARLWAWVTSQEIDAVVWGRSG
jgi:hypothetical protein